MKKIVILLWPFLLLGCVDESNKLNVEGHWERVSSELIVQPKSDVNYTDRYADDWDVALSITGVSDPVSFDGKMNIGYVAVGGMIGPPGYYLSVEDYFIYLAVNGCHSRLSKKGEDGDYRAVSVLIETVQGFTVVDQEFDINGETAVVNVIASAPQVVIHAGESRSFAYHSANSIYGFSVKLDLMNSAALHNLYNDVILPRPAFWKKEGEAVVVQYAEESSVDRFTFIFEDISIGENVFSDFSLIDDAEALTRCGFVSGDLTACYIRQAYEKVQRD